MNKIKQWSLQQDQILIDCAMAYGLEQHNITLNHDSWPAEALMRYPDVISEVHQEYLAAGSNVTITATYHASSPAFEAAGYSPEQAATFIQTAVQLARKAQAATNTPQTTWVAGGIGPYGAFLADHSEYVGNYGVSTATLINFHQQRFATLVAAGVDLIIFETIPDITELRAIQWLLSQYPAVSAVIACSIRDAHHISDGTNLFAVQALLEAIPNVIAYGFNCNRPDLTVPALEFLATNQERSDQSLIVFPNSGGHYDLTTQQWSPAPSLNFGKAVREWQAAHAKWIGGCDEVSVQDEIDMRRALFPEVHHD